MSTLLEIYINGKKRLDYDKNSRLPGKQRQYLDRMDLDMDEGIELNGMLIPSPDTQQRAKYVAMSLLFGIQSDSEGMIAATCAYLSNRLPELKQVRAVEQEDEVSLELIFNPPN